MNSAIISLGSNTDDKLNKLTSALSSLEVILIEATEPYIDPDDNLPYSPYLNIVAVVNTDKDYESLRNHTKLLERKAGRSKEDKDSGIVPLDIDIVVYNGKIIRPADFNRPYFTNGYSRLSSIKP